MKPYTYKITHIETGRYYIGYQERGYKETGTVTTMIGDNYYTSSDNSFITETYNANTTNGWKTEILNEYETGLEANNAERAMIEAVYKSDPLCINGAPTPRQKGLDDEEAHKSRIAKLTATTNTDEFKAKQSESHSRPEVIAKKSAGAKAAHDKKTPEQKAETAAKHRATKAKNKANKPPEQLAEETAKKSAHMKEVAENRSPEEKAEWLDKRRATVANRSPEEKAKIIAKRLATIANRSPEERAAIKLKKQQTRARNKQAKQLANNIKNLQQYIDDTTQ